MKTIEVNNMPILLDLRFELSLKNLEKYVTKKTPKYIIRSVLDDLDFPRIMASQRTKYYDIFEYDNIVLQRVHTEDGILIGYLKYESNNITIYNASSFDKEYMLSQYALVYCLRCEQNAIFMHGSSFKYQNKGIIFTAKSGTGKSTHRAMWQRLFDIEVINDDKNIVSLNQNRLYLSSSPWSGKHQIDNNVRQTLDAIVILYQSKTPEIKHLKLNELLPLLMPSLEALDSKNSKVWHDIFSHILKTPILYFGCNMQDESAYMLEKELKKLWE